MTDSVMQSSVALPRADKRSGADILLIVAAFVVVGLGAAWLLAGRMDYQEELLFEAPAAGESTSLDPSTLSVRAATGEEAGVNLSKARMAVSADMLVEPAGQNALYFYSLVLDADPGHAEAANELAKVAETVATSIRSQLGSGEFKEAARLASKLANVAPAHPVIVEVQEVLIAQQQRLVMEAMELARDGDDGAAAARLSAAESLPQVDDALIVTARQEIGAIRAERAAAARAAERERRAALERAAAEAAAAQAAQERVSADEAAEAEAQTTAGTTTAEPDALALGRERLVAGRLIEPEGDSALEYLAEAEVSSPDAPGLEEFRDDLITAISVEIRDEIDAGALEDAEELLLELESVAGAEAAAEALQSEVDQAFVRRESARVIPVGEMLATKVIAPVYPRSALRRGQEGWVEVEFTVSSDGSTAEVEVVSSSVEKVFDRASIRAVDQWQFRPRVFRGEPIDQRVRARISFTLQDS